MVVSLCKLDAIGVILNGRCRLRLARPMADLNGRRRRLCFRGGRCMLAWRRSAWVKLRGSQNS